MKKGDDTQRRQRLGLDIHDDSFMSEDVPTCGLFIKNLYCNLSLYLYIHCTDGEYDENYWYWAQSIIRISQKFRYTYPGV
jgi:hypothetical protein